MSHCKHAYVGLRRTAKLCRRAVTRDGYCDKHQVEILAVDPDDAVPPVTLETLFDANKVLTEKIDALNLEYQCNLQQLGEAMTLMAHTQADMLVILKSMMSRDREHNSKEHRERAYSPGSDRD